ncbi:MAG: ROK family protein [Anaerolineaceae bacterium]
MRLFGGIESGGTKFICMIGSGPDYIVAEKRIPTTAPDETIRKVIEFFSPYAATKELTAIGIASFGPLDLNQGSDTFGYITTTPKSGWQNTDLCGLIRRGLNVPVAFDTDVNAAAFGEHFWNKEKHLLDPFLYMTVGTGIGVGVIVNGEPLHGLIHPEAGHISLPHNWQRDPFPGVCPYHDDCLEGLASGHSMSERWGQKPETLPDDHPAWELEAEYLGLAMLNLFYAYSPRQIVLGGGVSQHPGLIQSVRTKIQGFNNGYVHSSMLLDKIDKYIHLPVLGNRSGVLGAMAMAIKNIEQV